MGHRSQNNYACAGGSFRQSQRPASMVRCSAVSRAAQVGKQPPTLDAACAPDGSPGNARDCLRMRGRRSRRHRGGRQRRIDPHGIRHLWRDGHALDEAFWMSFIGRPQDLLSLQRELVIQPPMHRSWRHQTKIAMSMLMVVPIKEPRRPLVRLRQAVEAVGIIGPILQRLRTAPPKRGCHRKYAARVSGSSPHPVLPAVGLPSAVIGAPRSACSVSWSRAMPCLRHVSAISELFRQVALLPPPPTANRPHTG